MSSQATGAIFAALMRTVASAIERLGETPSPQGLFRNLPMSYREDFANYIALRNRANSRKTRSYLKALDILSEIAPVTPMEGCTDFWPVDSPENSTFIELRLRQSDQRARGVAAGGHSKKLRAKQSLFSSVEG